MREASPQKWPLRGGDSHPVKDIIQRSPRWSNCNEVQKFPNIRVLKRKGHVGQVRTTADGDRDKETRESHVNFNKETPGLVLGQQQENKVKDLNGSDLASMVIFNDLNGGETQAYQRSHILDISEEQSLVETTNTTTHGLKQTRTMEIISSEVRGTFDLNPLLYGEERRRRRHLYRRGAKFSTPSQ